MFNWLTPQRWRQAIPASDNSSREVHPTPVVEEDEEDVIELDREMFRESKYDAKPIVMNDDAFRTPQRSPRRSTEGEGQERTQPSAPVADVSPDHAFESLKFDKLVEALSTFKPPTPAVPADDSRKNLLKIECSDPSTALAASREPRSRTAFDGYRAFHQVSDPSTTLVASREPRSRTFEEDWLCNVASEPSASKLPPIGCDPVDSEEQSSNVASVVQAPVLHVDGLCSRQVVQVHAPSVVSIKYFSW